MITKQIATCTQWQAAYPFVVVIVWLELIWSRTNSWWKYMVFVYPARDGLTMQTFSNMSRKANLLVFHSLPFVWQWIHEGFQVFCCLNLLTNNHLLFSDFTAIFYSYAATVHWMEEKSRLHHIYFTLELCNHRIGNTSKVRKTRDPRIRTTEFWPTAVFMLVSNELWTKPRLNTVYQLCGPNSCFLELLFIPLCHIGGNSTVE